MAQDSQIRFYENTVLRYNLPNGNAVQGRMSAFSTSPGPIQDGRTDMDVRGVGSTPGAFPVRTANGVPSGREITTQKPVSPQDQLEISAAGKKLDQLSQTSDIRQERIARIKEAIANGTYDTDEKLEAALSKMFDSLGLHEDDL